MEVFNWRLILAPQEEQEGQSEEEQLKQKTKERARKEFLGAVASEGNQTFWRDCLRFVTSIWGSCPKARLVFSMTSFQTTNSLSDRWKLFWNKCVLNVRLESKMNQWEAKIAPCEAPFFPRFLASYRWMQAILIGSFRCLLVLWLIGIITFSIGFSIVISKPPYAYLCCHCCRHGHYVSSLITWNFWFAVSICLSFFNPWTRNLLALNINIAWQKFNLSSCKEFTSRRSQKR